MDLINYFIEIFESVSDNRKLVLLRFIIKNDAHLLTESGFSKNYINRLYKKIKKFFT